MRGITILKRCLAADGDMKRLGQRIQRRRDAMYSITSRLDRDGGSGSADQDKIGRFLAAIDSLEREIQARDLAKDAEIAAACLLLDAQPEIYSQVLHAYYIRRLPVHAIAREMGYTDGYIRKLKADAERKIGDIPPRQIDACLPEWYPARWPEGGVPV